MHAPRSTRARRGGFTLIELLVVNLLMTLLVILIAGAWKAFGPLCVEVIARGRIVNEANIAAQALYQDANGSPRGLALARVETTDGLSLRFDYNVGGQVITDPNTPYPYVVQYDTQPAQGPPGSSELVLVRDDGSIRVTIARHLVSATASNIAVDPKGAKSQVNLALTFSYAVSPTATNVSQSQYTFAVHN